MDNDLKVSLNVAAGVVALAALYFAPIVREEWKKLHEPPYTAWTDKNRWE